jgi:acetate kinase
MKGVNAVKAILPDVPQIGVFDTAFHQTMPAYAYMYALPYEYYSKYHIRRYGFHGTSHRFVTKRVCEYLGIKPEGQRIITCHIGNGASIAAVKDGKSIDTSMGLTPLEGLVMGTRAGDIDAGVVTYMMDKFNLSPAKMSSLLNKESGVQGITEKSSDMRQLESDCFAHDERALLALHIYNYRIKKYIGAYAAAMNGVDIIVFTGGVGENQPNVRSGVCHDMDYLGLKFDDEANEKLVHGAEGFLSTPDSKVKVLVIPTDEELLIAEDTIALLK